MFLCSFRDAAILVACVDEVSMIRREVVMTLQKLAGVVTLDVSCNLCARTCYIYTPSHVIALCFAMHPSALRLDS